LLLGGREAPPFFHFLAGNPQELCLLSAGTAFWECQEPGWLPASFPAWQGMAGLASQPVLEGSRAISVSDRNGPRALEAPASQPTGLERPFRSRTEMAFRSETEIAFRALPLAGWRLEGSKAISVRDRNSLMALEAPRNCRLRRHDIGQRRHEIWAEWVPHSGPWTSELHIWHKVRVRDFGEETLCLAMGYS